MMLYKQRASVAEAMGWGCEGAKRRTHESSPLVLFRVLVNVDSVYEYPGVHLLYVRLKFDDAGRIIRVTCGLRSLYETKISGTD